MSRNTSRQATAFHTPNGQVAKQSNLRRNGANQVVLFEFQFCDAAVNAGDAGPCTLMVFTKKTRLADEWVFGSADIGSCLIVRALKPRISVGREVNDSQCPTLN